MTSTLIILTFVIFVMVFLWIGALASRASVNTDADYLLGNRSFGSLFIGLSTGTTANSGWIMIGSVGLAYTTGISSLLLVPPCLLGDWAFWHFFPDKINQYSLDNNAQTVPELLGSAVSKKTGKRLISLLVALITIIFIGAYTAGQFSAAAKTLDVFFGVDTGVGVAIAATSILIYCVTGGLRASIWTDVVQACIVVAVCFGMLIVAVIAGGGPINIWHNLAAIDPNLVSLTAGYTPLTLAGMCAGFFGLGFALNLSQPQSLVRLLACRSPKETRQARWAYLVFAYLTWTLTLLFGVICRVLIPGLADPEQALPFYAMQNFSPVMVGIVLAGIFSIIASTADSQLLVCASAVAREISPGFHQKMVRKYGMRYEQSVTLIVGILVALAASNLTANVFDIVLFASGAVSSSFGPAMFMIVLKQRTNAIAISSTIMAGLTTAIAWRVLGYSGILYEVFPGFLMGLLVHTILMRFAFPNKQSHPSRSSS